MSTRCLAMTGRLRQLTMGYLFSYMQLAASALVRKSLTYSSRMSMASDSIAPTCRAFWRTYSRSWRSCPTSPTIAMTSRPFSSMSHLMQTDVSRPPEYASTTLSFAMCLNPFVVNDDSSRAINRTQIYLFESMLSTLFWKSFPASSSAVMTRIVSSPAIEPSTPSGSAESSAAATLDAEPGSVNSST